ncbi:Hypothetical predicted protein [Pelobates cultripes]|uniref:Fucolectin tachylectin-4 pentraxin-1 domain-containing protein n=1 Tax=Pelobates cultripes TaxID=61616 RepID=A0AAD1S320_PELCU|nr:Hypothetical predicted protein [Pelobates cultripes]
MPAGTVAAEAAEEGKWAGSLTQGFKEFHRACPLLVGCDPWLDFPLWRKLVFSARDTGSLGHPTRRRAPVRRAWWPIRPVRNGIQLGKSFDFANANSRDTVRTLALPYFCSRHTNNDYEPWWKLDLRMKATIDSIIIMNRQDCCAKRLRGAQVKVGNSPDGNNRVCGTVTDVSQARLPIPCRGAVGRYVTLTIPGRAEYLTLCEVEVYGDEGNLEAGFGTVTQSSDYGIGVAIRAIDGNYDTNYLNHPCSRTNNDYEPWWKLDLRRRAIIDLITITNRQDCCAESLRGAQVKVGDSPGGNNPVGSRQAQQDSRQLNHRGCRGQPHSNLCLPGASGTRTTAVQAGDKLLKHRHVTVVSMVFGSHHLHLGLHTLGIRSAFWKSILHCVKWRFMGKILKRSQNYAGSLQVPRSLDSEMNMENISNKDDPIV